MGVRKSCADIIAEMVALSVNHKPKLAEMMIGLAKDGHKIVKLAACKSLP